jgi:hypothetical protein
MRLKLLGLLCGITSISMGQTSPFSIEASYPLPLDSNFLGDHFKGIADLGVKYRIKNLQVVTIGVAVNGSLFHYSDSGYFPAYDEVLHFKTSLYIIQPKFFGELNLKKINKLHPSIGVGYSAFLSTTTFDAQSNVASNHTNQGGVVVCLGVSYDILSKVYLFTSFDYGKLTQLDAGIPKSNYNTQTSLMKFGLGVRL